MKYLCLAYEAEETFTSMPAADWEKLRDETLAYVDELQWNGHLILANALQSARTSKKVKVREGKALITDGPFAETKEQLGGFFLIEANSLDEAIKIASKWPGARVGTIEVRPVEEALRIESRY
ncbi:MAG TPA: YciI family protein [Spongiibacteraceae bacterium]|nr:YciI family protein [Spongiibacteraceae bacterium]